MTTLTVEMLHGSIKCSSKSVKTVRVEELFEQ